MFYTALIVVGVLAVTASCEDASSSSKAGLEQVYAWKLPQGFYPVGGAVHDAGRFALWNGTGSVYVGAQGETLGQVVNVTTPPRPLLGGSFLSLDTLELLDSSGQVFRVLFESDIRSRATTQVSWPRDIGEPFAAVRQGTSWKLASIDSVGTLHIITAEGGTVYTRFGLEEALVLGAPVALASSNDALYVGLRHRVADAVVVSNTGTSEMGTVAEGSDELIRRSCDGAVVGRNYSSETVAELVSRSVSLAL